LQAIAHACQERGQRVIYIPSEAFVNDLVDAIRQRTTAMFRDRYRTVDVLCVDDIQFIAGKESTQEEFFHTFNHLTSYNKQIVLASDRHPTQLATLEDRLRSRFAGGLVMDLQPPEYETRVAILQMWSQERGIPLEPGVAERIAERASLNTRELEGAFNQMVATAHISRQPLNLDVADGVLNSFRAPRPHLRSRITIERVLEVAAGYHHVDVDDLVGPRRTARLNQARQIAMYLAREIGLCSLVQIGDAFGGRSHSTVLHSCNKVETDLPFDEYLRRDVEAIQRELMGG
jgi:chromosomal replication initiator protein